MNKPRAPDDGPQAELLKLIEQLEKEYHRLRDVDAQVSAEGLERLRELRVRLERACRIQPRSVSLDLKKAILADLAVEIVKLLFSAVTSIYSKTKASLQSAFYDSWRRHSDASVVSWPQADRAGAARGGLFVVNIVG